MATWGIWGMVILGKRKHFEWVRKGLQGWMSAAPPTWEVFHKCDATTEKVAVLVDTQCMRVTLRRPSSRAEMCFPCTADPKIYNSVFFVLGFPCVSPYGFQNGCTCSEKEPMGRHSVAEGKDVDGRGIQGAGNADGGEQGVNRPLVETLQNGVGIEWNGMGWTL